MPNDRDALSAFLAFARANVDHSFAQNFQDLFGLFIGSGRRDGYFVEFGALGGREFSNTYTLEKLGWAGIVAEPHPDYAKHVERNRTCHFSRLCVFDTSGDTVTFRIVKGRPAMSGIAATQLNDDKAEFRNQYREVDVETITLNDLLDAYDAPPVIDFVSIDTEGSEARILSAFDFSRRCIRSFCIEHNHVQRETLAAIMRAAGYKRVFEEVSAHDDWWILETATPPQTSPSLLVGTFFSEVFETNLATRREMLEDHLRHVAALRG